VVLREPLIDRIQFIFDVSQFRTVKCCRHPFDHFLDADTANHRHDERQIQVNFLYALPEPASLLPPCGPRWTAGAFTEALNCRRKAEQLGEPK
jgi:hypothetical protein